MNSTIKQTQTRFYVFWTVNKFFISGEKFLPIAEWIRGRGDVLPRLAAGGAGLEPGNKRSFADRVSNPKVPVYLYNLNKYYNCENEFIC